MSEKLTKATRFQYEQMNQMPEGEKPVFHVSAPAGWINDPNGFSVYKGKVHLVLSVSSIFHLLGSYALGTQRNG